jgi:hypothetical protein
MLRPWDNVPRKALAQEIVGNRLLFGNYEQNFDLKNHPQNRAPDVRDNPAIQNPRPDNGGRGITWDEYAQWITIDPTSLAPIIGNTNWQLANRTWDGI